MDLSLCELEEDVAAWLDAELVPLYQDLPSRSRSGRAIKSTCKEWPPRCPTGICDERKGCLCTHGTSVAAEYVACASQIHGADAVGMPGAQTVSVATQAKTTPVKSSSSEDSEMPPTKRRALQGALDACQGPREEGTSPVQPATSSIVVIDPRQAVTSPSTLLMLFSDSQRENDVPSNTAPSPVSIVDLMCEEDPAVALGDHPIRKSVTWFGLPLHPPAWIRGKRRRVPRLWEPCTHAIVQDGLLCLRNAQAPEAKIRTLPCFQDTPVWS